MNHGYTAIAAVQQGVLGVLAFSVVAGLSHAGPWTVLSAGVVYAAGAALPAAGWTWARLVSR